MENKTHIQHFYTTCIQQEIYTKQKNTTYSGSLGTGLEVLCHSLRWGAKRHCQNWRDVIPYQIYVYIDIYCIQNWPIHYNACFEGGSIIPRCYGVPTVVIQSSYQNMFIQHAYNTKFRQPAYTTRRYNTHIKKLSGK